MLSKNQMSMFLKTQMLCIIVNDALMSYVLTVFDFRLHNYYWPRIFILLNINCTILRKCAQYIVLFFNCLKFKTKCSPFAVKFLLIKFLVPLTNWCFFKSILYNCFLLSSAFLQYFLLTNLMMVFLEPLLDLPILWHSSTSLDSTLTSISERIDVTVDSSSESWTLSGMPEITKLFLLPYCSRASWEDSIKATLFSNCWHLTRSLSFSSCSLLMTVSFRLIVSSF